jgi:hypothetical protein
VIELTREQLWTGRILIPFLYLLIIALYVWLVRTSGWTLRDWAPPEQAPAKPNQRIRLVVAVLLLVPFLIGIGYTQLAMYTVWYTFLPNGWEWTGLLFTLVLGTLWGTWLARTRYTTPRWLQKASTLIINMLIMALIVGLTAAIWTIILSIVASAFGLGVLGIGIWISLLIALAMAGKIMMREGATPRQRYINMTLIAIPFGIVLGGAYTTGLYAVLLVYLDSLNDTVLPNSFTQFFHELLRLFGVIE